MLRKRYSLIILLIIGSIWSSLAQERKRVLDSLDNASENRRGVFKLYIIRPTAEIYLSGYRNRESALQGFRPLTLSYILYLPFQYDLSYVHLKAKEKLIKLNTVFILHHSSYFNYAMGIGERFSFLLFKHTYLSYQGGVSWCEVVNRKASDGINTMGFSFHHVFSLKYTITDCFGLSFNLSHLSGGNIFKDVNNNQDAIGFGASYQF